MSQRSKPARRQPQRTCIICRETSDKRALVRVVRLAQGGVQVDERGKVPGRGAYLCHKASCWQTALQGRALEHALDVQLSETEKKMLDQVAARFTAQHSTPLENSR